METMDAAERRWKRAMDIRQQYARAQVMSLIDQQMAQDMMVEVWVDASSLGSSDYYADLPGVPAMFRDVPSLYQPWRDGWNRSAGLDEMAECISCNDGTGNPCFIHDR